MEDRAPYFSSHTNALLDRPPVLVVCADPALTRMDGRLDRAGWRTSTVALSSLGDRLASLAAPTCMLVETDSLDTCDWEDEVNQALNGIDMPVILSGSVPSIDRMAAFANHRKAEILVDPSTIDLAIAVEAASPSTSGSRVREASAEPSAARLRQLSDEVSRIAASLARLSTGPSTAAAELPRSAGPDASAPDVSGEQVRAVIRARRMRARYFDAELFADPAWDMLLDLLQAEIAQHRVPVSSLCIAAAVPPTTALRWIKTMTDAGLFNRRADPHDGRRVFVELSSTASTAMRQYFSDVGAVAAA